MLWNSPKTIAIPFYTFDASEFLQNPLYFFLSFCSLSVSDALFDPLAQFFQFVFFSFLDVSPDLIVSFPGLFIFIFLLPRHNFLSLCVFFCCCCVCIFTRIACHCCMCVLTQILCCCGACTTSLPSTCSNSVAAAFAYSLEWCAASASETSRQLLPLASTLSKTQSFSASVWWLQFRLHA